MGNLPVLDLLLAGLGLALVRLALDHHQFDSSVLRGPELCYEAGLLQR